MIYNKGNNIYLQNRGKIKMNLEDTTKDFLEVYKNEIYAYAIKYQYDDILEQIFCENDNENKQIDDIIINTINEKKLSKYNVCLCLISDYLKWIGKFELLESINNTDFQDFLADFNEKNFNKVHEFEEHLKKLITVYVQDFLKKFE